MQLKSLLFRRGHFYPDSERPLAFFLDTSGKLIVCPLEDNGWSSLDAVVDPVSDSLEVSRILLNLKTSRAVGELPRGLFLASEGDDQRLYFFYTNGVKWP